MILLLIGTVLVATLTSLILYARSNYGFLESTGIPVVPPKFILGSDPNIHNIVLHHQDRERGKKYGRFWGVYEGRAPHVYIADPEIIRLVLIRDFSHFQDRRNMDFGHELLYETLDVLPYLKWKPVRNALTPSFTTGKIRLMSETMLECIHCCVENLKRACGPADSVILNTKRICIALTTDVIARCAFGVKLDSLNEPDSQFVKMLTLLSGDDYNPDYMRAWVLTFPFITRLSPLFPPEANDYFAGIIRKVMATRRDGNIKINDMVDTFNELAAKVGIPEFKRLGITEKTVVAQPLFFLFAGFETLATTLTMLAYRLAINPEKQEKLIKEVDALFAKNKGTVKSDSLRDMPYMTACVNETLRMSPPMFRPERVCTKDWKDDASGLIIKKGTVVISSSYAVHYNEKYWPDPHEFRPERFLPENKENINQYAFLSFGLGPRNCLGMKFARDELHLALTLILREFRFEAVPETKLKYKPGRQFLVQFEPIMLKFSRRK